jgi:hypothetical protein
MARPIVACVLASFLAASSAGAQDPSSAPLPPAAPQKPAVRGGTNLMLLGKFESMHPRDGTFKAVYGRPLTLGIEFRVRVFGRAFLSAAAGHLQKKGSTTLTEDPTTLTITPVEVTALYYILSGSISPYVGGGGGAYLYKESNSIGNVKGTGYGFAVRGGVAALTGRFILDAGFIYNGVKVSGADGKVDIGGLRLIAGAGIVF